MVIYFPIELVCRLVFRYVRPIYDGHKKPNVLSNDSIPIFVKPKGYFFYI